MKFIKIILLLSAIMLLFGCNNMEFTDSTPVTFSVLLNDAEDTPFQENWAILQKYNELQNVTFDIRLGDNKTYGEILQQTLESDDIPDIVLKCWPEQIENYAAAGILLPFSDYEAQMPYFMAYIKEHNLQSELDKLRLKNGKYYILPGFQREIQVQQWIYRKDAFTENNLPMPTTYNELFNSLLKLKEIYPDSTPITATWGGAHLLAMMGAGYGIPAGWAGKNYYNFTDDQWQYAPATENYRELYRFLNRCYEAGILDPAIFTQSESEFTKKLENGSAFVTVTWITSGFMTWNEKLKENNLPNGEWTALPVPVSTIGIKALPAVDQFRKGLVVPSRVINEPYFKKLLAFLDWAVYSEEGMTLTTWGEEGITYKKTAMGKEFLANVKTPKNPSGTVNISKEYGYNLLFNLNEDAAFEDYKKPVEIVEFLTVSQNAHETAKISPRLKINSQESEAIRILNEQLDPYVTEASQRFITGELSIELDWDHYLSQLTQRGYHSLETIWNSAWQNQKLD